jgi:GNAT superfamily N-acetyltransferase
MILRPLVEGDEAELRRIHATPEVVCWWDVLDESFPWEEPESTRLTIVVDSAVAGLIQFSEELEPKYRHAGIDLFLDPALHGRGLGTEAVRRVVRHLIDTVATTASRSEHTQVTKIVMSRSSNVGPEPPKRPRTAFRSSGNCAAAHVEMRLPTASSKRAVSCSRLSAARQQRLYFRPLPQGHVALREGAPMETQLTIQSGWK